MEPTSTTANFTLERDGRKAILTFTREDRLNALDAATFRDLLTTLDAIDTDPGIGDAIALAITFSAAVGIFFGFYPARKASRLDPIQALRYE